MQASDRISFRAIGGLALEAFRRRWWLLLPLAGAQWLLSSKMEQAPDVLIAGWPGEAWAKAVYSMIDDLGCGLMSAIMIALALTGSRREPLAAARSGLSLLAALPTILVVELVASGPGWMMDLAFGEAEDLPLAMLLAQLGGFLIWLAILLVAMAIVGAAVPLAIDQRLSPITAVKGALQLSMGHRKRLLWMALAFGFAQMVIALGGSLPFTIGQDDEPWFSEWSFHVIAVLDALVLAALYLELSRLTLSAPERTAETFA
jgi:hypothetical protein